MGWPGRVMGARGGWERSDVVRKRRVVGSGGKSGVVGHAGYGWQGIRASHRGHGEMERGGRRELAMLGEELLAGMVSRMALVGGLVHGAGACRGCRVRRASVDGGRA